MEDAFGNIKNELVARLNQLIELPISLPPKIHGDYFEDLLRDFIRRYLDKRLYEVKRGVIYDNKGQNSRECDLIIYNKGKAPLFESENLVIVNQDDVKFVLEVKSTLDSKKLSDALNSLKEVKKLNKHIMCWIVGFKTEMLIRTLYRKAWQSGSVQFLQVFHSKMAREKKWLIDNQTKFFVNTIRQCGEFAKYGYTDDFVIYRDGRHRLALTKDKQESENILSQLGSTDFWDLWNKGNIGDFIFEKPRR